MISQSAIVFCTKGDLIQNYIKNNPELAGCSQQEFFDDGFTGRNFERPAFEELLEKHTRAVAKDKQIIVEGMHEPIISKEVFLQAQELRNCLLRLFRHW